MWWIINIVILAAGATLTLYGWREGQEVDAYDAILPLLGGIILVLLGLLSSGVKVLWF